MTVADTTPANESGGSEDLERAAAVFADSRPRLFGIAHRMPGSAVEAEDLVQEVWLRRQTCDRGAAISPAAFLATVTARLHQRRPVRITAASTAGRPAAGRRSAALSRCGRALAGRASRKFCDLEISWSGIRNPWTPEENKQ
ncbi:sigma factor [Streptosporangium vulgare]|uniref:Sigma factor n=1 Tax=Streptosporangium vulgare TaxID=46190 RepID=A0ABV5TIG8_9ACTN